MMYEYKTTQDRIEADMRSPDDISWGDRDVFHGYFISDPIQPEGKGWELVGTAIAKLYHQNLIVWSWRRKVPSQKRKKSVK